MLKYGIIALCRITALFCIAGLSSCGVTDTPTDPGNVVRAYSYPLTNGLQYRYARFTTNLHSSSYDTATYQIQVGLSAIEQNRVVRLGQPHDTLYNFIFSTDLRTNKASVVLSNAQQNFIALEGDLADSSNWKADLYTTATVFAHYDEYVPNPPQGQSFSDVIVVRYHRSGDPADNYSLRFYSRGYGLILEKTIIGSVTVIGTLQLLEVGASLSYAQPADPGKLDHKRQFDHPLIFASE
jgi:hypothetical protein